MFRLCSKRPYSGPYTKIDMRSSEIDGYDAIFISPHKFIGGPGSPGILLVNKALYRLKSSPPSTCGGGTVAYVNGFNAKDTVYADNIEEREDAGTPAITQKIRAALAFWVKEYIGYKIIQNKEQSHIKQALNKLLQNPNINVLGNTTSKREAILSFLVYPSSPNSPLSPLANVASMNRGDLMGKLEAFTYINRKPLHGPFVAKILNDLFGIQARGGCACAGPYGHSLLNVDESQSLAIRSTIKKGHNGVKPGWTRISLPYYMSNEEFEFILEAVQFISIYGQRFLPLYHFNWNSGEWTFNKKMANGNMLPTKRIIDNLPTSDSSSVSINSSHKASRNETLRFEYIKYLETAKLLADCLPEFSPPRYIPKEIDPDLVYFRV
ncbi:hypothetical protein Leryth_019768 [Lithospermum erythrorhizon]|nr:hypothetical protein Leryth_019768 [Lithospermum erythrorhizon]